MDKILCHRRHRLELRHANSQFPLLSRIQGQSNRLMLIVFQQKLGQNGNTDSLRHHVDNGIVTARRERDVRTFLQLIQNEPNFSVIIRHRHDELFLRQCFQRNGLISRQRMLGRQQNHHAVTAQRFPLKILSFTARVNANFCLPTGHDRFNGSGTHLNNLDLNMRIIFTETADNCRQPIRRHTGICRDTDSAGVDSLNL